MRSQDASAIGRQPAGRFRTALVLGLGQSGRAAARLLAAEGARVVAVDGAAGADLERAAARLEADGVRVILGCRKLPAAAVDVGVVSPGIPADAPWVRELEGRGIAVISELELAARRCRCPLLAVTGSSGKSTLVKLCSDALRTAGKRVVPAANYGRPLSDLVRASGKLDWVVAEVSSFQLEKVVTFRPRVGVFLNLHPNHLDRHRTMAEYARAKARLFSRMGAGDVAAVLDANARAVRRAASRRAGDAPPRWVTFGLSEEADYHYSEGAVRFGAASSGGRGISVAGTMFANDVMGITAAAAVAAVAACGEDPACVAAAARRFAPLPHRMQEIGRVGGVRFVDDSKATTLSALAAGVQMTGGPVRLIAGGRLKERALSFVQQVLAKQVRTVYLIGEAADRLAEAWGGAVHCSRCGTLERATREAGREAEAGDTVLLSPGCASFDQFDGYEERGKRFARIVRSIHEKR
jgi:UDP-N-acetylmuramoylalanine--D-glutamate ligase